MWPKSASDEFNALETLRSAYEAFTVLVRTSFAWVSKFRAIAFALRAILSLFMLARCIPSCAHASLSFLAYVEFFWCLLLLALYSIRFFFAGFHVTISLCIDSAFYAVNVCSLHVVTLQLLILFWCVRSVVWKDQDDLCAIHYGLTFVSLCFHCSLLLSPRLFFLLQPLAHNINFERSSYGRKYAYAMVSDI